MGLEICQMHVSMAFSLYGAVVKSLAAKWEYGDTSLESGHFIQNIKG